MAAKKQGAGKRELIAPKGDKRFARRTEEGRFADNQDDVSRSLSRDVKQRAKKTAKPGQGDTGDQKRGQGKKRS